MKSSILPNFSTLDVNSNKLDLDSVSICSDSENRCESDYSLSDIEEGLDTKSVSSFKDSEATSKLIWSEVDLSIPVKVRNTNNVNLKAFVKNEDENSVPKKHRTHKRIGSDTATVLNKQLKSTTWLRKRASRLAVKQETALQGARVICRQLSNQSTVSSPDTNLPGLETNDSSNIPESDVCASPLRTSSSISGVDLKSLPGEVPQIPASDSGMSENTSEADQNFEVRQRSLTHSGSSHLPVVHRGRSSSMRPVSRNASHEDKHCNLSSNTTAAVRNLKHYQRAMDAYRKSAAKSSNTNSLPLRGARKYLERDSIVDFLGARLSYTSPESDDKLSESDKSNDQSSSSGASVANDDDITNMRRWPFVPMSGDVRSKFGDENSLDIDYRTVLRHGSLKRTQSSRAKLSLGKINPNRKSIDPDIVTDIDSIVDFGMNNKVDSDNGAKLNSPSEDNDNEKDGAEPEKIVWPGYEKYLRAKEDTKQLPRSSFKMRLAAMEKKGIDSSTFEALENDLSPNSTLKPIQDDENPYVNLRDNRIIRKRNLSRSNSSRSGGSQKEAQSLLTGHLSEFKSNTVASPGRLSRLLKNQSKLSPVPSPSLSRAKRTSSLKESADSNRSLTIKTEKASNRLSASSTSSDTAVIGNYQFPFFTPQSSSSRRLSRSLPRRKSNMVSTLFVSDANVTSSPDNTVNQSDKSALYLNSHRNTITPSTVIYDVPRSCKYFKNTSTVSSVDKQPTGDPLQSRLNPNTSTTVTYSLNAGSSYSSPNVAKSPSLLFAKAIADGRLNPRQFTPGNYPSLQVESDSEDDDYVSFDSFFKKQPEKSTLSKQKLQSKSVVDVSAPNKSISQSSHSHSTMSSFSKSTDALNEKENHQPSNIKYSKKRSTRSDHSKKTGSSFFSRRSISALDIFNSHATNTGSPATLRLPKTFLSKEKRRFTSSDLFYGVVKRQSKKTQQKSLEVSVPLTDLLNDPHAKYNLTLTDDANDARKKAETMQRISSFINDESIQKVEKLCEIFEQKSKNHQEKRATLKLLNNVSRVLRLHKITTKAASQVQQQPQQIAPQPQQYNYQHSTSALEVKSTKADDKKSKKKNKKSKLSKSDIGSPSDFKHVGHVGWDPNKGFDMNNIDADTKQFFAEAGVTEKDMQDQDKRKFIYDFIEKQGGLDAVRRETRRSKGAPPPPPPSRTGAPPPPPARGGAPPPPPQRAVSSSRAPPPPQRQQPSTIGRSGPPPPSRHAPPSIPSYAPPHPTFAPPAPAGVPPPPPPPPPPPATGLPPPPPAPAMGANLMSQIQQGADLKPAPAATAPAGRNALLEAIRKGKDLKSVSEVAAEKTLSSTGEGESLANALALALQKRENAIHTDSESDDSEVDDDDEWSD